MLEAEELPAGVSDLHATLQVWMKVEELSAPQRFPNLEESGDFASWHLADVDANCLTHSGEVRVSKSRES